MHWPHLALPGALTAPPVSQALKSYPGHCSKSCDHHLLGIGRQRSQVTPGTRQKVCCPCHTVLPGQIISHLSVWIAVPPDPACLQQRTRQCQCCHHPLLNRDGMWDGGLHGQQAFRCGPQTTTILHRAIRALLKIRRLQPSPSRISGAQLLSDQFYSSIKKQTPPHTAFVMKS